MRVAISFSLYMMRFGLARLAAYYASPRRPTDRNEISTRIKRHLWRETPLRTPDLERFSEYLKRKPGSPRYTPLRRRLRHGKSLNIQLQDYWLSDPILPSSAGALTDKYLDDPFKLCQLLGMTKPGSNVLLSRGRLSRYDPDLDSQNPFVLPTKQRMYLAFWLLDADRDWIWAFLTAMKTGEHTVITLDNRVPLMVDSVQRLLESRALRSGSGDYIVKRRRLQALLAYTTRNTREGLNLGQPWSWFLIPRLELLVEAGVLTKRRRDQLFGYRLTRAGKVLQSTAEQCDAGHDLPDALLRAYGCTEQQAELPPTWDEVADALSCHTPDLVSATGYYPLFESAVAICVERCAGPKPHPRWDLSQVITTILEAGHKSGRVNFGISRRGQRNSFKIIA